MTVLRRLLLAAVLALMPALPAGGQEAPVDENVLYLFWGQGCPHCAAERTFLAGLQEEYPGLEVREFEVYHDANGRQMFVAVMEALGEEPRAVPTTVYGGRVWIGFGEPAAGQIEAEVAARHGWEQSPPDDRSTLSVPLLGPVDIGSRSLLTTTVLIALVDGVNPCSLWALSILLALVVRTGSRRRVLVVGATFLAVTTALYGVYVAGMYGALSYAAHTTWVRVAMASIALAFGIVNVKDYFWFRRRVSLSIPARAKPGLYSRMRRVAEPGRPLPAVLLGTGGLAAGVSLLETPCTAGYPLLWADLLSQHGVGTASAAVLFSVYMLVFLLDELAVFVAAVAVMRAIKLEERGGRLLKLVGGVLMVALAVTLILFPSAMESLAGALSVFGVAAMVVGGVLAIDRLRRAGRGRRTAGRAG